MNIAIIGNSHFGAILAEQLNRFDKNNNYRFYNTNEKIVDKIKFSLHILNIDIVYSVSGSIRTGGALALALKFNKKIVQHFIGSDVLTAIEDFKNNKIDKKLIKKSKYFCEVDWIKEELKEINVNAKVQAIMVYENFISPQNFDDFSVLTYMGKDKEKFYGIDDFIQLAKDFPELNFKIAGIENYPNLPDNVKCLGWVDMQNAMQNATVFIRNVKHDGLGFTVIEALALGRVVFYNYEFSYVNSFKSYQELREKFEIKYQEFKDGKLDIGYEAIEFVKENFSKGRVLSSLVKELQCI